MNDWLTQRYKSASELFQRHSSQKCDENDSYYEQVVGRFHFEKFIRLKKSSYTYYEYSVSVVLI